jgi:hypothetical protein
MFAYSFGVTRWKSSVKIPNSLALIWRSTSSAFHSLLQPDSDQQTNDDGRDVDEKVFPRMDGLVGACTSNMDGRVFRPAVCSGISRTLIAGALNSPVAAMDVSRDDEAGSPFELSSSLCLPSFIEPIIPHAGPMSK